MIWLKTRLYLVFYNALSTKKVSIIARRNNKRRNFININSIYILICLISLEHFDYKLEHWHSLYNIANGLLRIIIIVVKASCTRNCVVKCYYKHSTLMFEQNCIIFFTPSILLWHTYIFKSSTHYFDISFTLLVIFR